MLSLLVPCELHLTATVQPLKVSDSTSIEIWNVLSIFVGVTGILLGQLRFCSFWSPNVISIVIILKKKEPRCVCVCVRAHVCRLALWICPQTVMKVIIINYV